MKTLIINPSLQPRRNRYKTDEASGAPLLLHHGIQRGRTMISIIFHQQQLHFSQYVQKISLLCTLGGALLFPVVLLMTGWSVHGKKQWSGNKQQRSSKEGRCTGLLEWQRSSLWSVHCCTFVLVLLNHDNDAPENWTKEKECLKYWNTNFMVRRKKDKTRNYVEPLGGREFWSIQK